MEPFDRRKLRGCLLRAMSTSRANPYRADALSAAIKCYLARRHIRCLSSAAVLEMVLTALRAAGLADAAVRLENWHAARLEMRGRLSVHHGRGVHTAWSKDWLVHQACSHWGLGRTTARILAGEIEEELMRQDVRRVGRQDVMRMLAGNVASCGLASPGQSQAISPPP